MSDEQLRKFFQEMADRRGIQNSFDRFETDSVVSDGLKLHLDIIEVDKAKPTVVFIPGTSVYAMIYGEFMAALADKGYNIVGFDPRGHGRSEGVRGNYTIPELVDDTRAAIGYARDRFGDPIAVAGSSQGGIVAFYVAATDEKLAGVICHNLADLGDPESLKLTRSPKLFRVLKALLLVFAAILPMMKIPVDLYLDIDAEEVKGFDSGRELLEKLPLVVPFIRLRAMASLASEKLPRPVEQITTPVQILHAGRDNIFPQSYIEYIYNKLTCKKSLKAYPDLPHLLMTDYIEDILPDVIEWLEEIF